jgi:hypothetical protein
MKTLFAAALLFLASLTTAFASGTHSTKGALVRHQLSTYDNNTILFAYPGERGTTYQWEQVEGPTNATLAGTATPTLIASGLEPGYYVFNYTSTDTKGAQYSDRVVVKVKQSLSAQ